VVEGQTHGATAQGISAALLEEVVYADGQPTSSTMMDYLLPTATDVPLFEIGHLEFGPPHLLRKFKGVGEGGVIGGGFCVANAVADAIGAEINKIPVTPREIVQLHRQATGGQAR
jgi:carbon-monoxide dehydrogenase large subunit